MGLQLKYRPLVLVCMILGAFSEASSQQKPQWLPGQAGLNAGILPSPGFTYANITINYDAGAFDGTSGNAIPSTGAYNVWAVENVFVYVPKFKFLGGNLGVQSILTGASGSLVADVNVNGLPNLSVAGGGGGFADLWLQPFTLGWHLKRVEFLVGDGLSIPTGRYSPGASNNVGTGYFGNHFQTGTTYYLTKNKGTSANLLTDWEAHGSRGGVNNTSKTPGQAFTIEWGVGQILPLKKDFSQLLQGGVIGYDQWQVTANGGTISAGGIVGPASLLPYYSAHAIGGQLNYILPAKNLGFTFKYEHEYRAFSHTFGNTAVIGLNWTLAIPKPTAPAP
jgi:hypothetical protein